MPKAFSRTEAYRRPVVYAGRFADQIGGTDLPNDCIVLGEHDTLLYELTQVLNCANTLVLLDLLSFPLQAMTDRHWDIPIVVVLPSGFDANALVATFGPELFERLGFFDHIVTPNSALWEELRRKYCWAEGQRIPVAGNRPNEVATTVWALFEAQSTSTASPSHDQDEAARYWRERTLATSVPHRESQRVDYDLRTKKASHRAQAAALEPRFAALRQQRDTKVPLDVLEVGTGAGRWTSSFDPTEARFFGLDAREEFLRIARINYQEGRFDLLGSDLLFPYEDGSFDLVFTATIMHQYPVPAKRTLLSEMWRVTKPGGRLLFLENFVFEKQPEQPTVHPMSVSEFERLILDATAGQVVLDYVESLRYPGDDLRTGMVISMFRLGSPTA
jgi:ubiquinone/menaquinone biosynthesis C-methylase UbiE